MAISTKVAKVEIKCVCRTKWGEKLTIAGSSIEFGQWHPERAVQMRTTPEAYPVWSCVLEVMRYGDADRRMEFKHVIVSPSGLPRWEDGPNRELVVKEDKDVSPEAGSVRYFSLFGDTARADRCYGFRSPPKQQTRNGLPGNPRCDLLWDITCPETKVGDRVKLVGNLKELGMWNSANGLELVTDEQCFPQWHASMVVELWNCMGPTSFEYKIVIIRGDKDQTRVEDGIIRKAKIPRPSPARTMSAAFRVYGSAEDRPADDGRSSRRSSKFPTLLTSTPQSSEEKAKFQEDSDSESEDSEGETDDEMPQLLPLKARDVHAPVMKRHISGFADWYRGRRIALQLRA